MNSPLYEYSPWSDERRTAASKAARERSEMRRLGIESPPKLVKPKLKPGTWLRPNGEEGSFPVDSYWVPTYPSNWWHKEKPAKVPRLKRAAAIKVPREPRTVLAYPFISKRRDEHADLLAVNSLVPRMPGREDVCQEIILAILEGRTTLDELKANHGSIRAFMSGFKRLNMEASGYALSLDAPRSDGRSWHDILVDPNSLQSGEPR